MSLGRDLRHGRRIGRAEFVRGLRRYRRDKRRLAGVVVSVLFLGGSLLVSLPILYVLARTVRTAGAVPRFGSIATLLPLGLLLVAVLRTLERLGAAEGEAMLLTTVHPRAVVVGLIAAEFGRILLWVGVPLLSATVVFALGLGAPLFVASAGLVVLPIVAFTTVWGYALGIGVLRLFRQLPSLPRVAKGVGVVALFGAVVLSQLAGQYLARNDLSLGVPEQAIAVAPLREYLSLAFVGTPVSARVTLGGLLAFAGWIVLTPVGLAVAERQATALWLTDGPARGDAASPDRKPTSSVGHFAPPRPFSRTKRGRIAWGFLVRAVRKPQQLVHLLVIAFYVAPVAGPVSWGASGETLAYVAAGGSVVLGAFLSGGAFGLNPLGDDRPLLPVVLLTETAPGKILHGRVLAGLTLGLPFAAVVPSVVLTIAGAPLRGTVFAIAGIAWCVLAGFVAPGLGCGYPVYEERELWGTETVAPSTLVLMVYATVVVGGTGLGLVFVWYALADGVPVTGPLSAAIATYLLLATSVPYVSYRYALRRYRRYVLD